MLVSQISSPGDWVTNVDLELQGSLPKPIWNKQSIYKISEGFGNPERKEAYKPKLVSFGPYHYGESQLKPVEDHKHRVLIHFLGRANKSACDCVAAVEGVVQQLMDSYDQLAEEWRDRRRFLQLMIRDGCFMMEILRNVGKSESGYADDDPIFSNHAKICKLPRIKRDMLMIENQLPLLLLKTLLAFETGSPQDDESINDLIMKFFDSNWSTSEMGQRCHVLDVVRQSMLQKSIREEKSTPLVQESNHQQSWCPLIFYQSIRPVTWMKQSICQKILNLCRLVPRSKRGKQKVIWPTSQLHEAGIRFERSKTQCIDGIKFDKGFLCFPSTLILPEIEVDDATESKFLNLLAFEQLHAGAGTEVSSYVSFMDDIIDTDSDVILLQNKKIIMNFLGTEKAIADLFRGLAYDVPIDPDSSLGLVQRDVNNYCIINPRLRFNQSLAELWKTYFRSPWTCISLLAAIFLLFVTATQTLFAVLDYYHH
ncbi:UPF0481 protein At3g47200-like [Magnolia sinica]|uniref:UPF0481 protein At3g47200-like n=1 Tax=Magnolia sinica TaxID=86752 RepID=UPI00265B4743|nr:UPF0481 protein At3g47200-like [Magnolia sinica]